MQTSRKIGCRFEGQTHETRGRIRETICERRILRNVDVPTQDLRSFPPFVPDLGKEFRDEREEDPSQAVKYEKKREGKEDGSYRKSDMERNGEAFIVSQIRTQVF